MRWAWRTGELVGMRPLGLTVILAAVLVFPAGVAAQDPFWRVIRPNVTWDKHWKLEPLGSPIHSLLDDPEYIEERPVLSTDRASATRPKQRFAIGFSDIAPGVERFAGGQVWIYIGIKKGTKVDFVLRTRRDGRAVLLSSRKGVTPPITINPEDPPVGRHGFRGWLSALVVPAGLTREEANRLSLTVRISPSSPKRSLSRFYSVFAELYPEGS